MSATHLPWVRNEDGQVIGADGQTVVVNGFASVMSPGIWQDEAKTNTAAVLIAINSHDELVAALRELMSANDAVQTALCDGPDVPGFDRYALPKAQDRVTEAEREAAHVLSRISDVQIKGAA